MSKLNENIKKFREMRRLNQKDLADQLNRSRAVISNWERGENSPDADTVEQICRVLAVTPNMLYGWDPCPDYEHFQRRIMEYSARVTELARKKAEMDSLLMEARLRLEKEMKREE